MSEPMAPPTEREMKLMQKILERDAVIEQLERDLRQARGDARLLLHMNQLNDRMFSLLCDDDFSKRADLL